MTPAADEGYTAEVSVERDGRRHAFGIGFATEQEDGTLAVTMSAVPVGNTIVLRPREVDLRKAQRRCYAMLRAAFSRGVGREVTAAEVLEYLDYGEMECPIEDLVEAFSYYREGSRP